MTLLCDSQARNRSERFGPDDPSPGSPSDQGPRLDVIAPCFCFSVTTRSCAKRPLSLSDAQDVDGHYNIVITQMSTTSLRNIEISVTKTNSVFIRSRFESGG